VPDETTPGDTSVDAATVLEALRAELARRGHTLSADSAGAGSTLYIMGANDLARALFVLRPTADDAAYELMYQGSWPPSMPPRFVVLPGTEEAADALDTLEQMHATPLLYDADNGAVTFRDLDELVRLHLEGR